MTLYAVLADIHANFDALQAVERDAEETANNLKEPLRYISLGDVIDYGPQPTECMNWIHKKEQEGVIDLIQGNHESDVAVPDITQKPMTIDNLLWAITLWTRQELSGGHKAKIRSWSREQKPLKGRPDFTLFHGSLVNGFHGNISNAQDALSNFDALKTKYALLGHTHYQGYFILIPTYDNPPYRAHQFFALQKNRNTEKYFPDTTQLRLNAVEKTWLATPIHDKTIHQVHEMNSIIVPSQKVMFNPGSVGQPRRWWYRPEETTSISPDLRAAYMLLHVNGSTQDPVHFAFRRQKYDTEETLKKLRKIRWQQQDAKAYYDLLRTGLEQRQRVVSEKVTTDQTFSRDLKFLDRSLSYLTGKDVYYKETDPQKNSTPVDDITKRLDQTTQFLIEDKIAPFFQASQPI